MADIVVQKDINNKIPKLGISAAQRLVWAKDYVIYDINADGSLSAPFGPTGQLAGAGSTSPRPGSIARPLVVTTAQLPYVPYQGSDVEVFIQDTAGGSVYPAPWNGTNYTAALQSLVSGARFQASGRPGDYISRFDGASSSGALGKPESMLIPANTLVTGRSQIAIRVRVRKTGTDAASFFQVHFGPNNGLADTNVFQASGITPAFTSANPYDSIYTILLTFKSGGFGVSYQRDATNVGAGLSSGECTGIDATVDNYLNFAVSGATASNTYDLISYSVVHQPSFT